jgi:hypothetical protein
MSILVINAQNRAAIAEAIAVARAQPIPWDELRTVADASDTPTLLLADRKPGVRPIRERYPPQNVMLGTYRCAVSFEYQPIGLCKHLSVSSARKGKVPGPEVMTAAALEFGFSGMPPRRPGRIWLEEFEPGWHAVNIVELEGA